MATRKEQLIELINNKVKEIVEEVKKGKKKVKKPTLEGITVEGMGNVTKDDLGLFYVVLNPTKGLDENSLVFETDLFNFTEKVQNGKLALENVKGIFKKQESAGRLKERLMRERKNSITDAKKSAEKLKGLRDEVKMKSETLKQTKIETQNKIKNIK